MQRVWTAERAERVGFCVGFFYTRNSKKIDTTPNHLFY